MDFKASALNKSFLFSNTLIYSTQALKLFFPLLILPFCTSLIGIEKFGIISVELSYVILLSFLIDFSVNVYGPSILASTDLEDRKEVIIRMTGLKFSIAVPICLVILLLNSFLNDFFTISLSIIFVSFVIGTIFDSNWVFLAEKSFFKLFISQLIGILLTLIFAFFSYKKGFDGILVVSFLLSLPLLISSIASFFILDLPSRFQNRKIPYENFKIQNFINEGLKNKSIFYSQIVSAMYTNSGPILLSFVKGPEVAGIWYILNRITTAISTISIVPYRSLFPDIVGIWSQKKPIKSNDLYFSTALYLAISIISYSFIYIFFAEVKMFFIESSEIVKVSTLFLMFIWTLAQLCGPVLTNYLIVKSKNTILFLCNLSSFIFLIIIFYPFTAHYSVNGWIVTMILSQILITAGFLKVLFRG